MQLIIYSIIVLCATMIGAITGLGGGIIIKPAFDVVGMDTTSMISVYSTVAVFTMCLVSIYKRSKLGFQVDKHIVFGLAFGSIIGGKIGDIVFLQAVEMMGNQFVSITQSIILFVLLGGIILFTLNKEKIQTLTVWNHFCLFRNRRGTTQYCFNGILLLHESKRSCGLFNCDDFLCTNDEDDNSDL